MYPGQSAPRDGGDFDDLGGALTAALPERVRDGVLAVAAHHCSSDRALAGRPGCPRTRSAPTRYGPFPGVAVPGAGRREATAPDYAPPPATRRSHPTTDRVSSPLLREGTRGADHTLFADPGQVPRHWFDAAADEWEIALRDPDTGGPSGRPPSPLSRRPSGDTGVWAACRSWRCQPCACGAPATAWSRPTVPVGSPPPSRRCGPLLEKTCCICGIFS